MQAKLPIGDRHPLLLIALLPVMPFLMLAAMVAGLVSKPVVRTRPEVADILQAFIDGTGGEYEWDDFICGGKIREPALEAIRARCASLSEEFPPTQAGHYCGEGGVEVLRAYVSELRASAP